MKKFLLIAFSLISLNSFAGRLKPFVEAPRSKPDVWVPEAREGWMRAGENETTVILTKVEIPGSNGKEFHCWGYRVYKGYGKFMYWTDHVIGTPGVQISVTSMSGLAEFDRLLVVNGTFPGFVWKHLSKITILPQAGNVRTTLYNGQSFIEFCYGVEMAYFSCRNFTGPAIGLGNGSTGDWVHSLYLHNFDVQNVTGDLFLWNHHLPYTWGDTTTLLGYQCKMDSFYTYNSGGFDMSFGTPGDATPIDMIDSLEVGHWHDSLTATNGTLFRGMVTRINLHDWLVQGLHNKTIAGDVGTVYINGGNGTLNHFQVYGGYGYVIRNIGPWCQLGQNSNFYFYDVLRVDSKTYGGVDWQMIEGQADIPGKTQGVTLWAYNNTFYNMRDSIGYWSPGFNIGNCVVGGVQFTVHLKNNFGIELNTKSTPPKVINFNGGSQPKWDTAKTLYAYSAAGWIDTTGAWPTCKPVAGSPLIGAGTSSLAAANDQDYLTMNAIPVIGQRIYTIDIVNCGNCGMRKRQRPF